MRIPDKHLPHRIKLEPRLEIGGSGGNKYDTPRLAVKALVVEKVSRVADQRGDSDTKGQEIAASTHIVMHLEDYVPPGSRVTIFEGTPAERIGEVVAAGYNQHPIAPNSAQLWLV